MNFRKYRNSDYKRLLEIYNDSFGYQYKGSDFTPSGNIYVLENNDTIIGMVTIDVITNIFKGIKYGYVNDVCICKDFRGMGYGKILMINIDEFAKKHNLSYVMLTSNNERKIAQSLYKKSGYNYIDTCLFKKYYN